MAQEKPRPARGITPKPNPASSKREEQGEARPAPPASNPISAEWQRRIERELEDGEKAVWAGQPDQTMALVRPLPLIAPTMAVLLLFLVGLVWIAGNELRSGNLPWLLVAGLLAAGMTGLAFVPLWWKRQARRTCYVVTSRRALIFQPVWPGKLNLISYSPEQLEEMAFERSRFFGPDAGDLVFRKIITTTTMHYIDEGRLEKSQSTQLFGFLMLRQAREVHALIVRQLLNPRRKGRSGR